MKTWFTLAAAIFVLAAAGCDNPKSVRRLRLPQGNAEHGKTAFVELKCNGCHTVVGVEFPPPSLPPQSIVVLGGEVVRVRTVGDLLTSIMHPNYARSDKLQQARGVASGAVVMPVVNDVMTVTQLIDLVAFLQPRYTRMPPPDDWYFQL